MQRNFRDFVKLVERNGYKHVRTKGSHLIFRNEKGRTLSVNIKLNAMVARRLISEYELV